MNANQGRVTTLLHTAKIAETKNAKGAQETNCLQWLRIAEI